jgi:ribonucleoside-diphosphate reductase alpha chain
MEKEGMTETTTPIGKWVFETKYSQNGESQDAMNGRVAYAMADDTEHGDTLKEIFRGKRFIPGGRILAAMGSTRVVTANNCYVMDTLPDSMDGIMRVLGEAAETMRQGGGVGYDFSTLRPSGARIVSLDSSSSGPISFMGVFDAMCATISSAGHRRGAQMGVLRVDHPDIEEFIEIKTQQGKLTNFNLSIAITDEFMEAVHLDLPFDLVFEGRVYKTISAKALWLKIMRATWDWAEPGVIFIDRVNDWNNLHYCETIASTNPCGEQPLPPYGACLLGSLNLVKYVKPVAASQVGYEFDYDQMEADIPHIVRGMDNVVDRAHYPLGEQAQSAQDKRRMGMGITGLANAAELLGLPYGSDEMLKFTEDLMERYRDSVYWASTMLAKEKGPFPLFEEDEYLNSLFVKTLHEGIQEHIRAYGIRNSHLLSIAPTGTISMYADNVSSGIEPPYSLEYESTVIDKDGSKITFDVKDWLYDTHGIKGRTAMDLDVLSHVKVLTTVQKYVDSAVSKTVNIGDNVTFEEFVEVYLEAYNGGAKGCTTFREAGKRMGVRKTKTEEEEGAACTIDFVTGVRTCDE